MGELVTELNRPEVVTEMFGSVGVTTTGWWFGTWILFFHILGIPSSQLTNSMIFQRGGEKTTNQTRKVEVNVNDWWDHWSCHFPGMMCRYGIHSPLESVELVTLTPHAVRNTIDVCVNQSFANLQHFYMHIIHPNLGLLLEQTPRARRLVQGSHVFISTAAPSDFSFFNLKWTRRVRQVQNPSNMHYSSDFSNQATLFVFHNQMLLELRHSDTRCPPVMRCYEFVV